MKTAKEKINNLLKSFSIKQLYFAAVLPLLILGYILIAFSVWNVYLHQMKNTLALETQTAIMNKADNFNGYFDSLYYATDSIIYSDITQQLLQKNVTPPSPDDQSLLTDILYNYMYHSSSSYVINSWTINNPIVTLSIQNAAGDLYATSAIYNTEKKRTNELFGLLKDNITALHGQGYLFWDIQSRSLYFFRAIYNNQISQTDQFLGLLSIRLSSRVFADSIGYHSSSSSTSYCFVTTEGEIVSNFSLLSDSDCQELFNNNRLTLHAYNYHANSQELKYGNFVLMGIINDSKLYAGSYRLLRHLLILISISVILITGSIILAYRVISGRFNQFIRKISSTDSLGNAALIHMNVKGEFEELENVYNSMLVRVSQLTSSLHAQELATKDAELASLYAQINPHFLYNTLDCINGLISLQKSSEAQASIVSLSKFLRFAIKADNIVSLQKELEYVRNYLFIEKIRYQNRLLVLIDVPEELNSYTIPKLTLQPLIENAIIHGFNDSFKEMLIAVTAASDDSSVILHIKDNGCGISEEIIDKINHLDPSIDMDDKNTGCNGIGLMNIQKRLRLTYGNNYGISIQKNFKDGTHILICIPKKQSGDMSN